MGMTVEVMSSFDNGARDSPKSLSVEASLPPSSGQEPRNEDEGSSNNEKPALSWVDKLLTVWILLAVGVGIGLSQIDQVREGLKSAQVGTNNIPIAIGLVLMMYPPLAKVHYDWIPKLLTQVRPMAVSIVQNWILGPLLMFFLAFAFLRNHPEYLQGVILVGCARCIAMVIVWNELAGGDSELCALLVALNSVLTVILYAFYAYALINKLLPALGVSVDMIDLSFLAALKSVAIYLAIPFVLGLLSWLILRKIKGDKWYYSVYAKWISPITLIALLYTIVILFALEGYTLIQKPLDILLCAAPMLIYFFVMFFLSFFMAYFLEMGYAECATIAFTAASNNFELALAVAVSVFGFGSPGAIAAIIGPLVEIPVMLGLVHISKLLGKWCFKNGPWTWAARGKTLEGATPEASRELSQLAENQETQDV